MELEFPKFADDKPRLMMWTVDQIIPLAAMFGLGLLTGTLSISILIGFGLTWAYTKYSAGRPDGFLLHAAYWSGLVPLKGRVFINPFHRRILPK